MFVPPGIGHLSLKRKGALSVAENGGSLRRSCEFGSDMLWPPPLESDGRSNPEQSFDEGYFVSIPVSFISAYVRFIYPLCCCLFLQRTTQPPQT